MRISKIVGCSLLSVAVAMLAACGGGGGGGDSGEKVVSTPIPTTVLVPFVRANFNTRVSGGLDMSTTPNHIIFADSGISASDGMTRPAGWVGAAPVWMDGYDTPNAAFVGNKGVIKENGKFFAACENSAQTVASNVASVNYPFQKGLNVFYINDAVVVTNFTELNGLTFKEFDCAGTTASKTFNSDGSLTSNGMQGTTVLATALFLTSGGVVDEGSTKTGIAFKLSTPTGMKYFLVTKVDSPLGRYYTFSYQQ